MPKRSVENGEDEELLADDLEDGALPLGGEVPDAGEERVGVGVVVQEHLVPVGEHPLGPGTFRLAK